MRFTERQLSAMDYLVSSIADRIDPERIGRQIKGVLDYQFQEVPHREAGGRLAWKDDSLEFRVVDTPMMKDIDNAISQINRGDYSSLPFVYGFIRRFIREADNPEDKQKYKRALGLLIKAVNYLQEGDQRDAVHDTIKSMAFMFLGCKYAVHYDDLPDFDNNFSIPFHVHKGGSGPSRRDLGNSKELGPRMVISATLDYMTQGTDFYILNRGEISTSGWMKIDP